MEKIFDKISIILKEYLYKYNDLYVKEENLLKFINIEFKTLTNDSGIKILDKSNEFEKNDGIFVYFFPEPYILRIDNSKIMKVKADIDDVVKLISLCLFTRIIILQEFVDKEKEIMALNDMMNILKKYNLN